MKIQLERTWELGEQIGDGGFGRVFEADSEGSGACVAKLVPKDRAAERELLFVDLQDVRHVVPIIESGATSDHWVLIMPRAECSLRERLKTLNLPVENAFSVMQDVAIALSDLDGRVVHRDIKPENTLLLNGHWCLADFGISRYAEATTAPDTQKFALTPTYAAPEQWRAERATTATDIYALAIMIYEAIAGRPPFVGSTDNLRNSHLHETPPTIQGVSPAMSALIEECLYKHAGARPSAGVILERLEREPKGKPERVSSGLAKLQKTNLRQVKKQSQLEREKSARQSAEKERSELVVSARRTFQNLSTDLRNTILASAPTAKLKKTRDGWSIKLGNARLKMESINETSVDPWKWEKPAFQVVAHTQISISIPMRNNYEGRSHSLWYCDAQDEGKYQWFETAFMWNPLLPRGSSVAPFALAPGEESSKALWSGMAEFQVAWPFEPFSVDTLDAFIDRWASWFADAGSDQLSHPSSMPERPSEGSWRKR